MSKLSGPRKQVKRSLEIGPVNAEAAALTGDLDTRIEVIQCLIPLGLQAVAEELQRAVVERVVERFLERSRMARSVSSTSANSRCASRAGSRPDSRLRFNLFTRPMPSPCLRMEAFHGFPFGRHQAT